MLEVGRFGGGVLFGRREFGGCVVVSSLYVELAGNKGVCDVLRLRCADLVLQAFRRLNAVSVPKMVSVPKNEEEDKQRGN